MRTNGGILHYFKNGLLVLWGPTYRFVVKKRLVLSTKTYIFYLPGYTQYEFFNGNLVSRSVLCREPGRSSTAGFPANELRTKRSLLDDEGKRWNPVLYIYIYIYIYIYHSLTAARNRLWVVAPSMLTGHQQEPMRQQQWVRCPARSDSSV